MRKIILALLLLALFGVHACADAPEQVRQSVVHLYGLGYDDTGLPKSRWTGSGFAVGTAGQDSDTFLTNWHVATGNGKFDTDHVRLWILLDDAALGPDRCPVPGSAVECTVLAAADTFPDVAVIRAAEPAPGYPALALMSSRQVKDQTPVYAFGFPGMAATRNGADSGPEDVVITEGTLKSKRIMVKAGYTTALIHSAKIEHGNSGGPLVNAEGIVVGLNTYGFEDADSADLFCSVLTDDAMKLLDSLGIAYETVPGENAVAVAVCDFLHMPNLPDAAAWGIFLLALVLAAAFCLYFWKTLKEAAAEIRQKLRKNPTEAPQTEPTEN